jgi:hypothetical protein
MMTWQHLKDDIVFSLQVLIHLTSMIDEKMTWMLKILFENVTRIKSFQIWLKIDYVNDANKRVCHYIDNVVIKIFYNDSKMIISHLIWV